MEMVDKFLTKMYRTNPDFVFTVTRDFVRTCQTPVLILPDDIPGASVRGCHGGRDARNGFRWRFARYVPSSGRIGLLLRKRCLPV
jgi:hypothetical protein